MDKRQKWLNDYQKYKKTKQEYGLKRYHKLKDEWESLSDDIQKELCLRFTRDYMKQLNGGNKNE